MFFFPRKMFFFPRKMFFFPRKMFFFWERAGFLFTGSIQHIERVFSQLGYIWLPRKMFFL